MVEHDFGKVEIRVQSSVRAPDLKINRITHRYQRGLMA